MNLTPFFSDPFFFAPSLPVVEGQHVCGAPPTTFEQRKATERRKGMPQRGPETIMEDAVRADFHPITLAGQHHEQRRAAEYQGERGQPPKVRTRRARAARQIDCRSCQQAQRTEGPDCPDGSTGIGERVHTLIRVPCQPPCRRWIGRPLRTNTASMDCSEYCETDEYRRQTKKQEPRVVSLQTPPDAHCAERGSGKHGHDHALPLRREAGGRCNGNTRLFLMIGVTHVAPSDWNLLAGQPRTSPLIRRSTDQRSQGYLQSVRARFRAL